ncbi:MAG: hypothetical protein IJP66_09000 [Kiritimatiellae bacterium]|nr:hypothetical protein [Kiritimatiellia bacterium]
MKKSTVMMAAAIVSACAMAQDNGAGQPGKPGRAEAPRRHQAGAAMMPSAGMWVPKMLSSKETLAKIGVTDEAEAERLAAAFGDFESQGLELEAKIREISREQAGLFGELLRGKEADPESVMGKIDEIAELRAKQGRLSVQSIIFLRDSLTQEQIDKALALVRERGRERNHMRLEPPQGARRPMPRDGRGPRGDGEGEMRPMPREGRPLRREGLREGRPLRRPGGGMPEGEAVPPPDAGEMPPPDAGDVPPPAED